MILVHVIRSWTDVQKGQRSADDATLGEWSQLSDKNIEDYGDVLLGIYENMIVSAYEIDGHYRDRDSKRVTFTAHETVATREFIGQPNPGRQWGAQGDARAVQALPTDVLLDPPVDPPVDGLREPRLRYRAATPKD